MADRKKKRRKRTELLDVISVNLWLLVHVSPTPAISVVLVAVLVTILQADAMSSFLPPKLSVYSRLMKFLNLKIVFLRMFPEMLTVLKTRKKE